MAVKTPEPNACIIDYETCGVCPEAALLSMGAQLFNTHLSKETEFTELNSFYAEFSLTEQFLMGRKFEDGAQEFWMKQKDTRQALIDNPKLGFREGFRLGVEFLNQIKEQHPGIIFFARRTHADYTWLNQTCKVLGLKNPVEYNNIFDVATYIAVNTGELKGYLKDVTLTSSNTARHNALFDCRADALQIVASNTTHFKGNKK